MLINLQQMLRLAEENQQAIGSFNVYNVESLQAVLEGSEGKDPVIIAFGEKYDSHMPIEAMAALVKYYCGSSSQQVVLHLDHCKEPVNIMRAIKAGFTSVMFDASYKPLAENIKATAEMAKVAHWADVSIEGELGYMNEEDGTGDAGDASSYTKVADAAAFASHTGVDALAIAIGNAHGIYKGEPHLDLERLTEIHEAIDTPLVLHGSSGIPKELLQEAIRRGIRKININTEVSTGGIKTARAFLQEHVDKNTRFETMTKAAEKAMAGIVSQYIDWFSLRA